jgi:hypothetical protein
MAMIVPVKLPGADIVDNRWDSYNPSMIEENFNRTLRAFQRFSPFRPFTLELVSGSRIEVNHPEALTLYENGLISCAATTGGRSVFEVTSVVRFLSVTGVT